MNKHQSTSNTTKPKTASGVVSSKKKSYAKPHMIESTLPSDTSVPSSFAITLQTPSLRWRSKPSINCCYHPICSMDMLDTTAIGKISSHRYDILKASLHSTLTVLAPTKNEAVNKTKQKIMPASKSFAYNIPRDIPVLTIHKGSMQNIPTHAKRRYWVPTPIEMVKIGDKIPKAFVKTSLTGRKTVQVPTNTRSWFRGSLTRVESSASITRNQSKLVRGARLLNRKPKKNDKEQKCPSPMSIPLKPSKTASPEPAGKKPGKHSKNDLPSKPPTCPKTKKIKEVGGRIGGESSKCSRHRDHHQRPLKLSTVYMNTKSSLNLRKAESTCTASLPTPYTPSDDVKTNRDTIAQAAASVGFNAYVECFYCRVRFRVDELAMHQIECCERPSCLGGSAVELANHRCDSSLHKLDFNQSSSCLLPHYPKPLFIENGGQLSSLPRTVSSNDGFNKTCWYCGWEYSEDISDRHSSDCAAIRGVIRPTAEGKKLRRLVERKMKTYSKLNPRKKNLW